MQSTYYAIMKFVDANHCVEQLPRARSRRGALAMAEKIASDGSRVRVEKHVRQYEIVRSFNKPARP